MNRFVDFSLTGSSALLMHKDDVLESDRLQAWRKDPDNKGKSQSGDDRSPAWTWQTYCYNDGNHITMPYENVMVCLRQAATQILMKGKKTYKELSQSAMLYQSENAEFLVGGKKVSMLDMADLAEKEFTDQANGVRNLGFQLFVKRAKIGQSKHIRVRPRFDDWQVNGTLWITSDDLTDSIVEKIFQIAGKVGLGDWRPGCKTPGPYGMFQSEVSFGKA